MSLDTTGATIASPIEGANPPLGRGMYIVRTSPEFLEEMAKQAWGEGTVVQWGSPDQYGVWEPTIIRPVSRPLPDPLRL